MGQFRPLWPERNPDFVAPRTNLQPFRRTGGGIFEAGPTVIRKGPQPRQSASGPDSTTSVIYGGPGGVRLTGTRQRILNTPFRLQPQSVMRRNAQLPGEIDSGSSVPGWGAGAAGGATGSPMPVDSAVPSSGVSAPTQFASVGGLIVFGLVGWVIWKAFKGGLR